MANYRRNFVPGGTYFFTVVTANRQPIFHNELARTLLGLSMRECFQRRTTKVLAMVLLPQHLHAIWELPPGDSDYSVRWQVIKAMFTNHWNAANNQNQKPQHSLWQRRFWEHTVKDEEDLEAHFDYIHYNPVKHQLVSSPKDWPWSTFHRWVECGHYHADWGAGYIDQSLPGGAGEFI